MRDGGEPLMKYLSVSTHNSVPVFPFALGIRVGRDDGTWSRQ